MAEGFLCSPPVFLCVISSYCPCSSLSSTNPQILFRYWTTHRTKVITDTSGLRWGCLFPTSYTPHTVNLCLLRVMVWMLGPVVAIIISWRNEVCSLCRLGPSYCSLFPAFQYFLCILYHLYFRSQLCDLGKFTQISEPEFLQLLLGNNINVSGFNVFYVVIFQYSLFFPTTHSLTPLLGVLRKLLSGILNFCSTFSTSCPCSSMFCRQA